jgi:4-azaleucine resistance transporter AzlC
MFINQLGCIMQATQKQKSLTPLLEFRSGFADIIPLAFGAAIYGIAFGLLASQAEMSGLQTGIMGTLVFAGSSQIVATERLVAGAGALTALIAGIALNLRILLMTASLRDELVGRPIWQILLGVHLTTDENWALMHATRAKGHTVGYWYLVGGGACLICVWVIATVFGVSFAKVLPESLVIGMDFAFTAAFIAILRNLWRGTGDLLPWVVSIGSAGALTLFAPIEPSWALALGGVCGAFVAGVTQHD